MEPPLRGPQVLLALCPPCASALLSAAPLPPLPLASSLLSASECFSLSVFLSPALSLSASPSLPASGLFPLPLTGPLYLFYSPVPAVSVLLRS